MKKPHKPTQPYPPRKDYQVPEEILEITDKDGFSYLQEEILKKGISFTDCFIDFVTETKFYNDDDYEEGHDEIVSVRICQNTIVPNESYEAQMKQYDREMRKYETNLKNYNADMVKFNIWQDEQDRQRKQKEREKAEKKRKAKEEKELQLLEKLRKKYEK